MYVCMYVYTFDHFAHIDTLNLCVRVNKFVLSDFILFDNKTCTMQTCYKDWMHII